MNLKRKGMASVESLMLIAVGAAILMGLTQYWQTQLAPQTKNLIAQVLGEDPNELPEADFDIGIRQMRISTTTDRLFENSVLSC